MGPRDDKNLLDEMGYEVRDIPVKRIPTAAWLFFLFTAVSFLLAWAFLLLVAPDQARRPDLQDLERRRVPPPGTPILQSDATALRDMSDLIREERRRTSTYNWSDRKSGYVSVPIDEAVKAVVSKGLPERPNARVPEGEWTP